MEQQDSKHIAPGKAQPSKRNIRYLLIYTLALFSVFALLIFMTYMNEQQRKRDEEQDVQQQQQSSLAVTAMERIEELQKENAALRDKNEQDRQEITNVLQQIDILQEQIDILIQGQKALASEDTVIEERYVLLLEKLEELTSAINGQDETESGGKDNAG